MVEFLAEDVDFSVPCDAEGIREEISPAQWREPGDLRSGIGLQEGMDGFPDHSNVPVLVAEEVVELLGEIVLRSPVRKIQLSTSQPSAVPRRPTVPFRAFDCMANRARAAPVDSSRSVDWRGDGFESRLFDFFK